MAKKIKLEMTEAQYSAMIELVSENAITIGGADEEFSKNCVRRVNLFNKMLRLNGIKEQIYW